MHLELLKFVSFNLHPHPSFTIFKSWFKAPSCAPIYSESHLTKWNCTNGKNLDVFSYTPRMINILHYACRKLLQPNHSPHSGHAFKMHIVSLEAKRSYKLGHGNNTIPPPLFILAKCDCIVVMCFS